mgnify:CR=1 FL=1
MATPLTVRLESFEGPLDLLLCLIRTHELDISKVSIGNVTDQYLAYVQVMKDLNFDLAGEFLVMAATLIKWKSQSVLPNENEDEINNIDSEEFELTQEQLILQMLEHQRYLAAGESLLQLPKLHEDVFLRENKKPPANKIWKEMNITGLAMNYQQAIVHSRKRSKILQKETVSLSDKIVQMGNKLELGRLIDINKLMSINPSTAEKVVTFLASLELSRLKKLRLYQEEVFHPILLELIETLENFNLSLATGFDAEPPTKATN